MFNLAVKTIFIRLSSVEDFVQLIFFFLGAERGRDLFCTIFPYAL